MAKRKAIDDERLEEIKAAMCDHYCRFPLEYSMEYEFSEDGYEKMLEERCAECPMNDL